MAINILLINLMSTKLERVFSSYRRTLSQDRARLSTTNLSYIKCLKNWQKNLYLEEVDLPIDEGEEDGKENQEDHEGQGDTLEGQGHGDDDDGVGIGIIPLDN